MEAKFTNGEWYCVFDGAYSCVGVNGKVVADLRILNAVYNKYDAHLIAAAPEMYKMLETAMNILNGDDFNSEVSATDIEKLLTKASGEI